MSIKTWKAEFYKTEGIDLIDDSDSECLDHSLLKWTGLLEHNLKKHECFIGEYNGINDLSGEEFDVSYKSCSLCLKYTNCEDCVIKRTVGYTCDIPIAHTISDWHSWVKDKNPIPMIKLLKRVKKDMK